MSKGVLFDATKCIGCRACQVACKSWNENRSEDTANRGTAENPPHLSADTWTKMRFTEIEGKDGFQWVFTKLQCMHCEHPACATACIVGAFEKTKEGAVVYDAKKCIGCRYCMVACPFGVPAFEWDRPIPYIRKCTFCFDRLKGGMAPSCATACPSGALSFGDRAELLAEAKRRIETAPARYVPHVYGEKEAGGTCWLYISSVPFESVGFPKLGPERMSVFSDPLMHAVPPVAVVVAGLMTGIYWFSKRREKIAAHEDISEEKE
ncbi:MAG: 4Fe-4S dicluster domain-containing protein [Deltaproteobacteria bacterium]|nr:4Fe-4S dicluster domain-containing protein [Deltaproteobacteria bacterium]